MIPQEAWAALLALSVIGAVFAVRRLGARAPLPPEPEPAASAAPERDAPPVLGSEDDPGSEAAPAPEPEEARD